MDVGRAPFGDDLAAKPFTSISEEGKQDISCGSDKTASLTGVGGLLKAL